MKNLILGLRISIIVLSIAAIILGVLSITSNDKLILPATILIGIAVVLIVLLFVFERKDPKK